MNDFYFFLANGMHFSSYRPLFNSLLDTTPIPFNLAPFDSPPKNIPQPLTWHYFTDRIDDQISTSDNVGFGHSLGGTILLYDAIKHPERWRTIFITEPALFSPGLNQFYRFIRFLRLDDALHPMIRMTKKRRDTFASKEDVFQRWRTYPTFQNMSDDALRHFVDATLIEDGHQWRLRFPKDWEIEIYRSMCTLDPFIWKHLPSLQAKLIVIAGETSNTFLSGAKKRIQPYCHDFITIPNTTHLLPFETPVALAKIIEHHT